MPERIVTTPVILMMNFKPWKQVGWLHTPVKLTRKDLMSEEEKIFRTMMEAKELLDEIEDLGLVPVRQEITEGKNKIVHGIGLVPKDPKKPHLRLIAVDGKIIDPDFQ